ncbi:MAG: TIGR04211 family SH3 domain-containing protein [Woeseiaceae bacterium]
MKHSTVGSLGIVLAALITVGGPASAQEQTAYVTDVLRLGLHAAEDTSDRAFRSLESGQEMRIISRDRSYAQVRLPDGTTGYVKAAYLVDEKPARLIVEEMRTRADAAQVQLDAVTADFSGSAERINSLETALQEANAANTGLQERVSEVSEANADFEQKMKLYGFSLPWPMALGAVLIALIIGFAAGFWWIDSRSRKRHGGFRIY